MVDRSIRGSYCHRAIFLVGNTNVSAVAAANDQHVEVFRGVNGLTTTRKKVFADGIFPAVIPLECPQEIDGRCADAEVPVLRFHKGSTVNFKSNWRVCAKIVGTIKSVVGKPMKSRWEQGDHCFWVKEGTSGTPATASSLKRLGINHSRRSAEAAL
jgi:hypothetical protein